MIKNILRFILSHTKKPKNTNLDDIKDAIGIDVSGPEFRDLYPTRDDIALRLERSGLLHANAIPWISSYLSHEISKGQTVKATIRALCTLGRQLTPDELKAIGLNPRRKLGAEFVEALAANDISAGIDRLTGIVHAAKATVNTLHNFRRQEEAGVTHVIFCSVRDERETALERALDGTRLSISDARTLVLSRGDEITRGFFRAEITF